MENKYFKYGNVISPLTSSDAYSSLYYLDPVLYNLQKYILGILDIHCKSRWNLVCNNIGRTDLLNKVVNQCIPYDPFPFATDTQYKFPLVCIYRTDESYEWHSSCYDKINSNFHILYILPPLDASQCEIIHPFLTHVNRVVVNRVKEGSDEQFNSQEQVWINSGLKRIGVESCEYAKIPALNSKIHFPATLMNVVCEEKLIDTIELNMSNYAGCDGYLSIHSSNSAYDGYANIDYPFTSYKGL